MPTHKLLHRLRAHAEQDAADGAGAAVGPRAAAQQAGPGDRVLALVRDGPLDLLGLRDGVRVRDVDALEVGDDGVRLGDPAPRDQPARALGQPGDRREQDEDEEELQRQRQPPGDGARGVGQPEGHPVAYDYSRQRSVS